MSQASERALRIAEEITRRTSCDHYRLALNEQRQPTATDSKIGGMPYWPAGKEYPTDGQGKPMMLVMQINCAQAGLQAPLPEQGMLQWFISLNPELQYGCRGNYDEQGDGFRVVYHDTIGESAAPAGTPTHATVDAMLTPVKREVAIDVVLVPGMAFDSEGNRLGRGKGYYDRFLKLLTNPRPKLIGVCFDFQKVDMVPTEPTDVKVDVVV